MKIRNILFGYRYTEGKLVFHPTESEVMKEIYKAYLEGNSLLKPVSYTHLDVYKRQSADRNTHGF